MLVIRVFDVLEGLCAQFASHVTCCTSGTCPQPDEVSYETRPHDPYDVEHTVEVCVGIVHDRLSAAGGKALSGAVQNRLIGAAGG